MREREIQKRILVALTKRFHPFGMFWTNDTGVARSQDGQRMIRYGAPGSPDILGLISGFFVGIEVKRPGKTQQPNQIVFEAAVKRAGGVYIVATSPADAISQIEAALWPKSGEVSEGEAA